jgi:hypothetical protein
MDVQLDLQQVEMMVAWTEVVMENLMVVPMVDEKVESLDFLMAEKLVAYLVLYLAVDLAV